MNVGRTNGSSGKTKLLAKKYLFPGLDLHTRCRYAKLPALFLEGELETLDAGFGNGALSFAAYKKGNRVIGISNRQPEINATRQLFDWLGIPRSAIELHYLNIYDLQGLNRTFDQIICSETLEHITRDQEVISTFADLLRPKGRLILCCPYALHPQHAMGRIHQPEDGGHVRDGYTLESYSVLLETAGLTVVQKLGLGAPVLCSIDRIERWFRNRFGDLMTLPLFFAVLPLTWLDYVNPEVPFSLAVVAEKLES